MSQKVTTIYDINIPANGIQVILADANFYKVLTSTGDIEVRRDGGSAVRPMRAGRGERNVDFQRLTLKDLSGALNTGSIAVGDSDFIDDTIVLSSAISVNADTYTGSYKSVTALAANTPEMVFSPASNVSGVVVWVANFYAMTAYQQAFIAKSSAPTSVIDGDVILSADNGCVVTANSMSGSLKRPIRIPAGKGLYFISGQAEGAIVSRSALFSTL